MLRILSDSFSTAARQKSWADGDAFNDPDRPPSPTRQRRNTQRHQLRRWLRDTGIM